MQDLSLAGATVANLIWIPERAGDTSALGQLDIVHRKRSWLHRRLTERGLGGYEPSTTAGLLAAWELVQNKTFFDVGANIGIYSLLHQRHWPGHETVAFEPYDRLVEATARMASANGIRIRHEPVALSSEEGEAKFYISAKTDASNSLTEGFRKAKDVVTVRTSTLDRYVEASGLVPGVVKIDVEQHEPAVIRGARHSFTERRPIVVVEMLAHKGSRELTGPAQETRTLLHSYGYVGRHLVPPDGMDGSAMRDWLFLPQELDPHGFDERFRGWLETVRACGPMTYRFTGVVASGNGRSARRMRRRRRELRRALGYTPELETLALKTGRGVASAVAALPGGVVVLEGGDPVTYHKMTVDGIAVHVRAYREGVELVSTIRLREALNLEDGDEVAVEWSGRSVQASSSGSAGVI